jgi:hypothetical protein
MSDPERLTDGGGTELERALLRSAARDRGSDRAARRTIGLFAAALSTAVPTAAAAAAPTALLIVKWAGLGVIAGITTTSVIEVVRHEPARTVSSSSELRRAAPRTPAPASAAASPETPKDVPQSVSSTAAPAVPAPAELDPRPRVRQTDSLAAELALLDDARGAIARRDAALALTLLDRHKAGHGSGVLAPEALLLRIEALLLGGNRRLAERLGSEYLTRQPSGPHADRIRSLLLRSSP